MTKLRPNISGISICVNEIDSPLLKEKKIKQNIKCDHKAGPN